MVNPSGGSTDPAGCVHTVFSVPQQVAGDYFVNAYASGFSDSTGIAVYHQPYMQALPPHYSYQLVGATGSHPNNHYGSTNAVYLIQQICIQFYNETGLSAGVNDMSLPLGGVFDIGPPYGSFWQYPHIEHRRGLNADVPFQFLGTMQQRQRFQTIAQDLGGNPLVEGDHFHLRFSN